MKEVFIIGIFLLLVSFNAKIDGVDFSKELPLSEGEHVLEFDVKLKQTIEILLEGNPTTGYTWLISKNENSFSILKPLNLHSIGEDNLLTGKYVTNQKVDKNGYAIMGAGGKYSFKFEVESKGVQELEIYYSRLWENNSPYSKVKLIVKCQ